MASPALLPPEDLAVQLGNIETILSVYGGTDAIAEDGDAQIGASAESDELVMSESDEDAIRDLARFLGLPLARLGDSESTKMRDGLPQDVVLGLRLDPLRGERDEDANASGSSHGIILEARFPLRRKAPADDDESSMITKRGKLHPLWPAWTLHSSPGLSHEQYHRLCTKADEASRQVLDNITNAQA